MWMLILGFLKGPLLSFLGRLWGWLQVMVSVPAWLLAAALLVGLGWHWKAEHAAVKAAAAQVEAKDKALIAQANDVRDQALAANATNQDTIKRLQGAQAQCEAGRIADQAAQARAMADRERAATASAQAFARARAELDALHAGRCASWANEPACGER
jgi:hypothetical protein